MSSKIVLLLLSVFMIGCNNAAKSQDDVAALNKQEQSFKKSISAADGKLIRTIGCSTKTAISKDAPDGKLDWIDIKNRDKEAQVIINADEVVIEEHEITIIIDYPLSTPYKFELKSDKGFTRGQLVTAIFENYYKLYEEEERTATIKTLPVNERKTMYNRNRTNGKYGIWGHDIDDLALSGIEVYKATDGKIVLALVMES